MATKNTNAAAKPAAAKKSAKATKAAEKLFGEKAVAEAIAAENATVAENATPAEPVVNSAIANFVATETNVAETPATPVVKAAKVKDVQNGVTRKGAGTVDAKFWGYFDSVVKDTNVLPTLQQAVAFATANSLNVTTAGLSLSYWKRYNGITSKAAKPAATPVVLATPAEFAEMLGSVTPK